METSIEHGYLKGEMCNRDGCTGILMEHASEGGCSCHINPPCSYCTDAREYCNECGWEGGDEQAEYEKEQLAKQIEQKNQDYYAQQRKDWDEQRQKMRDLMAGKLPRPAELTYMDSSHTHFSMIKEGVFPDSMTLEELRQKIDGTFGGRFEILNKETGHFKFIAYTD